MDLGGETIMADMLLFSTADYSNWFNATNGYDIYDNNGSYTYNYDESFYTSIFNETLPTNSR